MNCDEVRKYLSEYLDGNLPETPAPEPPKAEAPPALPPRPEVEAHLKTCPDCSRELELLRKTVHAVRSLPKRSIPAHVQLQIERSVEREMLAASEAPPPLGEVAPARSPLRWLYPAAAAASLLVVVGLAAYFYLNTRPPAETPLIARGISPTPEGAAKGTSLSREEAALEEELLMELSVPTTKVPLDAGAVTEELRSHLTIKGAEEKLGEALEPEETVDHAKSIGALRYSFEGEKPEDGDVSDMAAGDSIVAGRRFVAGGPAQPIDSQTQDFYVQITQAEERGKAPLSKESVADAVAELESILSQNQALANTTRTDNVYFVNRMKTAQLPALVNDLSRAQQLKLQSPPTSALGGYSFGVLAYNGLAEIRATPLRPATEPAASPAPGYVNIRIILQTLAE